VHEEEAQLDRAPHYVGQRGTGDETLTDNGLAAALQSSSFIER